MTTPFAFVFPGAPAHSRPMKIIVLGAGIIGATTAWHLLESGHEVIVVDRQADDRFPVP